MGTAKERTIIIRGKKEKVFNAATEVMEKAFPRIDEPLNTQFFGFEERKDFWGGYLALLYTKDNDQTLRDRKPGKLRISDAQQVFRTGNTWVAMLTIAEWRLK